MDKEGHNPLLSPHYIAGLTDGEGSFWIQIHKPNPAHQRKNYLVRCLFSIKMREDELPLLLKVRDFFGCGKVYHQKEYRARQHHAYRFEIGSIQEHLDVTIPFFEAYTPQSTTRLRDFQIWTQIVQVVNSKAHLGAGKDAVIEHIFELKDQLHRYQGDPTVMGLAVCGKTARTVGTSLTSLK